MKKDEMDALIRERRMTEKVNHDKTTARYVGQGFELEASIIALGETENDAILEFDLSDIQEGFLKEEFQGQGYLEGKVFFVHANRDQERKPGTWYWPE